MSEAILSKIQSEIKAPKGQYNKFGKFRYRSCEDILVAAKPILEKYDVSLILDDLLLQIGDRYYVKATAALYVEIGEGDNVKWQEIGVANAYAREPETKKGMDESQITGSASSYARKYALAGLFLLDDNKDADSAQSDDAAVIAEVADEVAKCETLDELKAHHEAHREFCAEHPEVVKFYSARKKELNG